VTHGLGEPSLCASIGMQEKGTVSKDLASFVYKYSKQVSYLCYQNVQWKQ
jgi:hypothetical protein